MFVALQRGYRNAGRWTILKTRDQLNKWQETYARDGDIIIDFALSQCYEYKVTVTRTTNLVGIDDETQTDLGEDTFPFG